MSAVQPRTLCRSTLAPRFSSTLTSSRWSLAAAACSRVSVEVLPPSVVAERSASIGPPLRSHLTTFCSSPRCANRWISKGRARGVGELIAAGHVGRPDLRASSRSCAPPLTWAPSALPVFTPGVRKMAPKQKQSLGH
eukprot:scaffold48221_cov51-Phaeocystis_antarctica.AAC.8